MEIILAIDYYDLIWFSDELFAEEQIDRWLDRCARMGITAVQWRLSVCGQLLYHTQTGDMFTADDTPPPPAARPHRNQVAWQRCREILRRGDPLEIAVRLAHKHGLKIYPWLTLYDDYGQNGELPSSLVRRHPEWCWRSRQGNAFLPGTTSYAYPEVAAFRLRQIREIASYGADGLYLCNRSHSRPDAYHRAIQAALADNPGLDLARWHREQLDWIARIQQEAIGSFGFDPPAVQAYQALTGQEPDNTPDWWRFRGRYVRAFLREVRREISGKLGFGLRYDDDNPYFIYGPHFFDWPNLAAETGLDEIHYLLSDDLSRNPLEHFAELAAPRNCARMGWCWLGHPCLPETLRLKADPLKRLLLDGHLDGIVLFEAYHFLQKPEYWSLIDFFTR